MTESGLFELAFQRMVFPQRDDLYDDVDVACRSHRRAGRFGDQQSCNAAADEDEPVT